MSHSQERFPPPVRDGVNLASRLEGLNKKFGTYLMVSHATYSACKDDFHFRKLSKVPTASVRIERLRGLKTIHPLSVGMRAWTTGGGVGG